MKTENNQAPKDQSLLGEEVPLTCAQRNAPQRAAEECMSVLQQLVELYSSVHPNVVTFFGTDFYPGEDVVLSRSLSGRELTASALRELPWIAR